MSDYPSIKELVIDTCASEGEFPSYEKLTGLVLQNFPNSKWQRTHFAWYKSQINRGKIFVPGFGDESGSTQDQIDSEVDEVIEASLSLERDLHAYLAWAIHEIESGLTLRPNGIEHQIDAGRIDLLATDAAGSIVVIELKAGVAKDAALGQLLGYIGCIVENDPHVPVRGILIASDFDKRVVYAAKALPQIKLVKYKVSFQLQAVT